MLKGLVKKLEDIEMKFLIIPFYLLVISQTEAQQITEWMNPKPFPGTPTGTFYIDEKNGWMIGKNSSIAKTTDYGQTWVEQNASNGDYDKIVFSSFNEGWLVGHVPNLNGALVCYTTNSGKNWIEAWNNSSKYGFFDIDLKSLDEVYIAGGEGVYKTTNRGKNWQNLIGIHQNTVYFSDKEIGFCGDRNGRIRKTTNGGLSWQTVFVNAHCINRIRFLNDRVGYAVGYKHMYHSGQYKKGLIIKTTDAGNNWVIEDSSRSDNAEFTDIAIDKKTEVCVVTSTDGKNKYYYKTNSGWADYSNYSYADVNFSSVTLVGNSFYVTGTMTERGKERYYVTPLLKRGPDVGRYPEENNVFRVATKSKLNSVDFINDTIGWVVGNDGTILKTTNGGANWEYIKGFSFDLLSVSCCSPNIVFAAGNNILIKSYDAGKNWELTNFEKNSTITGIKFINEKVGFAFRYWEQTLKTIDGGRTWMVIPNSSTSILPFNKNLWWRLYREESDDYTNSYIFKSTDNGTTWIDSTYFQDVNLLGFSFVDDKNGWCYSSSSLLRTEDGGMSWKEISGPEQFHYFQSFYAISKKIGFMIQNLNGHEPSLFITKDGGYTFTLIKKNIPITDIEYGSANYGWGIGDQGAILRINHKNLQ